MDEPVAVPRPAARVLLFDDRDRLLLFRMAPEVVQARRPIWFPPGGGVNEGETHLQAVYRELWEETGLRDFELGPCIWRRSHRFVFQGALIEQRERYFVARCRSFEVATENMEEYELSFLSEHRWWALDEIGQSDEWFVPRALASLLPGVLAGDYPDEPIDVGI